MNIIFEAPTKNEKFYLTKQAQRGGKDDPKVRKAIMDALPLIFEAIDLDDDGEISFNEFKLFFLSFDVSDEKFSKEVSFLVN